VVTTRDGGVSTGPYATCNLGLHVGDDPAAVVENRRRAAGLLGAGLDDLVLARQVHGAAVAPVGPGAGGAGARAEADALGPADALVTTEAGPVLCILVADCVPVLLVDPGAPVLAVVHAGWRGTVSGVVAAAVAAMAGRGARSGSLLAAVGPAVGPDRYQVGPEVAEAVTAALGPEAARAVLAPDGGDRSRLDLGAAVVAQLAALGLAPDRILTSGWTTGPDGPFFSDRAARPCGRFGLLACLAR
jgi:YfiH family protein